MPDQFSGSCQSHGVLGKPSVLELVADAAHRFDVAATVTELLAQADHLDVYGTVSDGIALAMHVVDNLRPGGIAMINQVPVCNAETERKFRAWCAIKGVEVIEFRLFRKLSGWPDGHLAVVSEARTAPRPAARPLLASQNLRFPRFLLGLD